MTCSVWMYFSKKREFKINVNINSIIFQAPGQACWVLWKNILGPYFMQRTPEDEVPEINEKKQKKLERRKKRQQNVRF